MALKNKLRSGAAPMPKRKAPKGKKRSGPAPRKAGGGLSGRLKSQVEAEATLRFNPERSTLEGQKREIQGQAEAEIASARGSAKGIRAAAQAADPKMVKVFGDAAGIIDEVKRETSAKTAGLGGPAADGIKASISRDEAGTTRRLSETLAGARGELAQRSFDAEAGRVHAEGSALARAAGETQKLSERLRNIGVEEGAFRQGRAGELTGEQQERKFKAQESRRDRAARSRAREDEQDFKQGENAKNRDAKAKGTLPGGVKPATGDAHRSMADRISKARAVAQRQKRLKQDRSKAAGLLVNGRDEQTFEPVLDEKRYKRERAAGASESEAKRRATREPGFKSPKVEPVEEKVASVALDVAYDGYVSKANAKWLHENGYSLKQLGLPTATSTGAAKKARDKRARRRKIKRPAVGAGRTARPT